jgi:oligopeptide transport system substrate-binding protein
LKSLKRIVALLLTIAISVSLLAGCGNASTQSAKNQILRLNNTEEPGSLHPAIAQGTHESWILENLMEGLYKKESMEL